MAVAELAPALVACGLLLSIAVALMSLRAQRKLGVLRTRLHRAATYHAEGARFIEGRELLAKLQAGTEGVVEGGTALVRGIHHGIAAIPFSILEAIPATREPTRLVRGIHDLTANSVYAAVAAVNRVLGTQLRKGLQVPREGAVGDRSKEKKP